MFFLSFPPIQDDYDFLYYKIIISCNIEVSLYKSIYTSSTLLFSINVCSKHYRLSRPRNLEHTNYQRDTTKLPTLTIQTLFLLNLLLRTEFEGKPTDFGMQK